MSRVDIPSCCIPNTSVEHYRFFNRLDGKLLEGIGKITTNHRAADSPADIRIR